MSWYNFQWKNIAHVGSICKFEQTVFAWARHLAADHQAERLSKIMLPWRQQGKPQGLLPAPHTVRDRKILIMHVCIITRWYLQCAFCTMHNAPLQCNAVCSLQSTENWTFARIWQLNEHWLRVTTMRLNPMGDKNLKKKVSKCILEWTQIWMWVKK